MFKRLLIAITASVIVINSANSQSEMDGPTAIRVVPMAQVHEFAERMASTVNASAPIQIDTLMSATGATYTRTNNTFRYDIQLTSDMRSDEFFQTMQKKLCAGKIVVALMERTVQFVYAVTTPRYRYTVEYNYFHC